MKIGKHLIVTSIVLGASSGWALDSGYGYKVTDPTKSLSQIAIEVYGNASVWPEISYWNNLKKPYSLSLGQVLYLSKKPKSTLAKKNLVEHVIEPNIQLLHPRMSVSRNIIQKGKDLIYVVNERAPWLLMVARDIYGNDLMAREIAKWNHLSNDAKLTFGQHLILKEQPKNSPEAGNAILLQYWKSFNNKYMVQRLGGQLDSYPTADAPSEKIAPVSHSAQPMPGHTHVVTETIPAEPAAAKPVNATPVIAAPVVTAPVVAAPVAEPVVAKPIVAKPVAATPVAPEPVVAEPVVAAPVAAPLAAPVAEPTVAKPVVATPVAPEPVVAEPVFTKPVVVQRAVVPEPAARAIATDESHQDNKSSEPKSKRYWLGDMSDKIIEDISKKIHAPK